MKFAFTPFSEGPRMCLGRRFAEVEFMTVLCAIVQQFEVGVPKGVDEAALLETTVLLTLRNKNPAKLTFTKRCPIPV